MSIELFTNAFSILLNQNRDGSIVRGGLTSSLLTNDSKKCPKLSTMVQNVIKASNLIKSCTMVDQFILEGEPPSNCSVKVSFRAFSSPPLFSKL